jgi:hypothetical protein
LPDAWGPVIVAAVQGRLRFEGNVARIHSEPAPSRVAPTEVERERDREVAPRPHLNAVSANGKKVEAPQSRDQVAPPPPSQESDDEKTVDITEPAQHQRPRPGAWRSKPSAGPWVSNRTPSP